MTVRLTLPVAAILISSIVACSSNSPTPSTPVSATAAPTTAPATSSPATAAPATAAPATQTPATQAPATTAPVATAAPQVVQIALPSDLGSTTDGQGDTIGGYSQQSRSQTLGFVPGAQVMLSNIQSGIPHTLGDTGGSGSFPSGQPSELSTTASSSSTISSGWQSGTIQGGSMVGPFTLAAGTYYVGCAYHYQADTMRTILTVGANATPGPQAQAVAQTTPAPAATATPASSGPVTGY